MKVGYDVMGLLVLVDNKGFYLELPHLVINRHTLEIRTRTFITLFFFFNKNVNLVQMI